MISKLEIVGYRIIHKKAIASVSFGKDSLAMLLGLIETKSPLDEVVFYDTGMEFDEIYQVRDAVLPILEKNNIKYTELHPKRPFIDTMINYPHKARNGTIKKGYGWCGGMCRWGTTEKLKAIDQYCKNAIQYVGIAYDEKPRLERLKYTNKISPLGIWKMTEKDCLEFCYKRNVDWGGLYNILDRVSCWCCRNKNLKELANYYHYLPKYFKKLVELEGLIGEPMKKPKWLTERFCKGWTKK